MVRGDKPRIRLGFNSVTGKREFIVIEPVVNGFGFLNGSQLRAIYAAHQLTQFLNQGLK